MNSPDKSTTASLEFTGERYIPEESGDIALEHLHRYALAQRLAKGKRVRDLACGEGYGSNLLADTAISVTGVDVSHQAVAHATVRYAKPNLCFIASSAAALPMADGTFDIVVSFETIEHLHQQQEMLDEICRVLAPEGTLLISSPNKLNYSDIPGYDNPYHVKELYRAEFEALLKLKFRNVAVWGQRIVYGSLIAADIEAEPAAVERSQAIGLLKPRYDLAVASNGPLVALSTTFYEADLIQSDLMVQLLERIKGLEAELEKTFASRSWKITIPLRFCLESFQKLKILSQRGRR